MRNIVLFLLTGFCLSAQICKAQGCSDAGFCTIGSLKPGHSDFEALKKQKITLIMSNGIGDEKVNVFTPGIQYDNRINNRWAIQTRLTGNFASGNLGNASGLGDLILSGTHSLASKSKTGLSFLLGTKLPLNNSNLSASNKPLPMQYQSSLGTVDIIGGVTLTRSQWLFALAVQQPLTGRNRNTFLPVYWGTPAADKYIPTNDFNRKGDVLLRADYRPKTSDKWTIHLGLLGIYHLGKDTYIDGNISKNPISLTGSEGLTLNGTVAVQYRASRSVSLGLSGGVPFVVRDIRPDGLTRKFVIAPEIAFHF
jgi:hypothetical protein